VTGPATAARTDHVRNCLSTCFFAVSGVQPSRRLIVRAGVREESSYFRRRAAECRELAKAARDKVSRRELDDIADELDAEADRIDAEGKDTPKAVSSF
jgi:hypothetical protein